MQIQPDAHPVDSLSAQYRLRFGGSQHYRDAVWKILVRHSLQRLVGGEKTVLDLGCGWGEFIRNIDASEKLAMDLNAEAEQFLGQGVRFIRHDCAEPWPIDDASLDVVFSSNFLEHLPSKAAVQQALMQARRCLKPGGSIILVGPNLRFTDAAYWDFWDHNVAITDKSLAEVLAISGFRITRMTPRFLPYTMSDGWQPPLFLVRVYLALPFLWRVFGKQFLVVATA